MCYFATEKLLNCVMTSEGLCQDWKNAILDHLVIKHWVFSWLFTIQLKRKKNDWFGEVNVNHRK
jgi:hypothetical protein